MIITIIIIIIIISLIIWAYYPRRIKVNPSNVPLYIGEYVAETSDGKDEECYVVAEIYHIESGLSEFYRHKEEKIIIDSVSVKLRNPKKGEVSPKWIYDNLEKFNFDINKKFSVEYVKLFLD